MRSTSNSSTAETRGDEVGVERLGSLQPSLDEGFLDDDGNLVGLLGLHVVGGSAETLGEDDELTVLLHPLDEVAEGLALWLPASGGECLSDDLHVGWCAVLTEVVEHELPYPLVLVVAEEVGGDAGVDTCRHLLFQDHLGEKRVRPISHG